MILFQFTSDDIRQKAAAYLRRHKDTFLPFLTNDDGEAVQEIEFDEYCMKVEKSCKDGGVWGGEPEVIFILVFFFVKWVFMHL